MISHRDLLHAANVQQAAKQMRESKIGCLPVISEYDLLGIVERL